MNPENNPTRRAQVALEWMTGKGERAIPSNEEIEEILSRTRALLPNNYKAGYSTATNQIVITGHDYRGWTMDDYVLPRLASGLIFAKEIE